MKGGAVSTCSRSVPPVIGAMRSGETRAAVFRVARPRARRRAVWWFGLAAVALLSMGFGWRWLARGEGPAPGVPVPIGAATPTWDRFVKRWVDQAGRVSYGKACVDPDLRATLQALASADLSAATPAGRQAFRLNGYNAFTVAAVCRNLPLKSLKDRPWEWKTRKVWLAREQMTLDGLETRTRFDPPADPRIHFALNCASASCPLLRREAYTEQDLGAQLEDQQRAFLADPLRNPGLMATGEIGLSSLFSWYAADFARMSLAGPPFEGRPAGEAVALRMLYRVSDAANRAALERGGFRVRYVDYDWSLNDRP